jgi:hypothetical protein
MVQLINLFAVTILIYAMVTRGGLAVAKVLARVAG